MREIVYRFYGLSLGLFLSSSLLAHPLYQEYAHTHPHPTHSNHANIAIPQAAPLVNQPPPQQLYRGLASHMLHSDFQKPGVLVHSQTPQLIKYAYPAGRSYAANQAHTVFPATQQQWVISPYANFYGGLSLGKSEQHEFEQGRSTSGKLYGGVHMRDSNLGAEVGYIGLGSVNSHIMNGRNPGTVDSESDIFYAAATGYISLNPDWELLGKAGVAYWNQENIEKIERIKTTEETDENGFSALLGIGTQYRVAPNVRIRGEFEHIFGIGEGDHETDASLISVGATFSSY